MNACLALLLFTASGPNPDAHPLNQWPLRMVVSAPASKAPTDSTIRFVTADPIGDVAIAVPEMESHELLTRLMLAGRYAEALALIDGEQDRALPRRLFAPFIARRYEALVMLGRYEEALETALPWLRGEPFDGTDSWLRVSFAAARLGKVAPGQEEYVREFLKRESSTYSLAEVASPADRVSYLSAVALVIKSQLYQSFDVFFAREALAKAPRDPLATMLLCRSLIAMKKYDEVPALLEKMKPTDNEDINDWLAVVRRALALHRGRNGG